MSKAEATAFEAMGTDPASLVDKLVRVNTVDQRETQCNVGLIDENHRTLRMGASMVGGRSRGSMLYRASSDQESGAVLSPRLREVPSNDNIRPGNHLNHDPAELLRKIDELRDQLHRSCDVTTSPKETKPRSRRTVSSLYDHHGHCTRLSAKCLSPCQTSVWYPHDVGDQNSCSHLMATNSIPRYGKQLSRAPCHGYTRFPEGPRESYRCQHSNRAPIVHNHYRGFCPQNPCTCLHCRGQNLLPHQRFSPFHPSNQREHWFIDRFSSFGSESSGCSSIDLPVCSHNPTVQRRTTFVNKRVGRTCWPISGAAPFIICNNCFELLQIPSASSHKLNQLRCGSCSKVITFKARVKKEDSFLVSSTMPPRYTDTGSNNQMNQQFEHHHPFNANLSFSSPGNYDSPENYFKSSHNYPVPPINGHEVSEKEDESPYSTKKSGLFAFCKTPGDVEGPENVNNHTELPCGAQLTSHDPVFHERSDYPLSSEDLDGPGEEGMDKSSEHQNDAPLGSHLLQQPVVDVHPASEVDMSVNEYPSSGFSQDSLEEKVDGDQHAGSKNGDSFFAGLMKKGFKEFSLFNQPVEGNQFKVSVNGHPISERSLKKAVKKAGPIDPGGYWYDYHAGFWGVMGHECLGIIPPFIKEFNYPMYTNCAGGNTGVLVNGRELHQRDLDLLVGRGLPATSGRTYKIEISGKVFDESSGELIHNLGKLAPTMEILKCGFGMHVPQEMA